MASVIEWFLALFGVVSPAERMRRAGYVRGEEDGVLCWSGRRGGVVVWRDAAGIWCYVASFREVGGSFCTVDEDHAIRGYLSTGFRQFGGW